MFHWPRIIIHYLLIAVLLTLVVLVGSAALKVAEVEMSLNRAIALIAQHEPELALYELLTVEESAVAYPELVKRFDLIACKAYASAGDFAKAEATARALQGRPNEFPHPATFWSSIHAIPDPLMSDVIMRLNGGRRIDRQSGMEVVAAERAKWAAKRNLPPPPPQVAQTPAEVETPPAAPAGPPRVTVSPAPATPPPPLAAGHGEQATAPKWGIVVAPESKVYDLSGSFLRRIDAGTIVEISSLTDSSTGRVAVCTAMHPGRLGAPVIVRDADLEMYTGDLAKISDEERTLRIQRAQILAQIERLRASPDASNPFYDEYQAAKQTYARFCQKEAGLQKKMDASTGDTRMRYYEELRKSKGEDLRLSQAVETVRKKFEGWKAQHPQGSGGTAAKKLETDLAALETRIRSLAPAQ